VQFYELDGAGIVHFSNYLRYVEEAEHALWREAGLNIADPGGDLGFPRVNVSCDYHRPLRFADDFEIQIRIVAMAEKSIRYACALTRGSEKVATVSMTVVCVQARPGERLRAVPIPAEIVSRFAVTEHVDA
jgi:YbgC/YbaW family acyl-CoA thioester hydrolase